MSNGFMDFTNINDPNGIKALLDQLRTSQAWQDSVASGNPDEAVPQTQPSEPPPTQPHTSIASLLSQLQPSPSYAFTNVEATLPKPHPPRPTPSQAATAVLPSSARKQDVRWLSFQQALPHIAQLSDDLSFSSTIAQIWKMKEEQVALETQLHEERKAILRKHEEKVKVARTKGYIVGGLSRHEADWQSLEYGDAHTSQMMSDAFRKELRKFDFERALTAWDGLVTKQQAALEGLGVPGMFITDASADREHQEEAEDDILGVLF
ncbi:hypothetical protein OE88DRAFT_1641774 [Heliocybe sulcata]|uniref:Uncharacterized protein n=1 Tax=Heliocybe sulcata TaxID=5364 RepID=A0A5C3NF95_9AGAM|nr:hypothetical protein OE88DRAFT_1641774 [Heliocybe sulcata]